MSGAALPRRVGAPAMGHTLREPGRAATGCFAGGLGHSPARGTTRPGRNRRSAQSRAARVAAGHLSRSPGAVDRRPGRGGNPIGGCGTGHRAFAAESSTIAATTLSGSRAGAASCRRSAPRTGPLECGRSKTPGLVRLGLRPRGEALARSGKAGGRPFADRRGRSAVLPHGVGV